MRLFTVQNENVVNQLQSEYTADFNHVDDYFKEAYLWYMKTNRLPNTPIWAFDKPSDNYRRRILKSEGIAHNDNYYEIELEVPDELVVKSNFDYWHAVLGDWSLAEDGEEIPKEESWLRIFDESWIAKEDIGIEQRYQYTFPSIKPEYLINIKKVTTGPEFILMKVAQKLLNLFR